MYHLDELQVAVVGHAGARARLLRQQAAALHQQATALEAEAVAVTNDALAVVARSLGHDELHPGARTLPDGAGGYLFDPGAKPALVNGREGAMPA